MAAPATSEQLEKLRPYFAGEASPTGEVDAYCPMHADNNRSAQINVQRGVWKCHACGAGGRIDQLVECEGYWIPLDGRVLNGNGAARRPHSNGKPEPMPTIKDLRRWHESLMSDEDGAGTRIHRLRGLTRPTAVKFMLGWDGKRRVYTIPVRSTRGKLWNVRRWTPDSKNGGKKIWGIKGHNDPRLFPAAALIPWDVPIIICGGEWDALTTIQEGFCAITRTGAEHVWNKAWNEYFANREVYLCHDMDETGRIANGKIRKELEPIATSVRTIQLPYPYRMKHGNDLNDFWLDGGTPYKFQQLMKAAA